MNDKLPEVFFLFLDEKYADLTAPREQRVTSLTGLLVPAKRHREFRKRYYSLIRDIMDEPKYRIGIPEKIHASNLLPNYSDCDKFKFLQGVVEIVNDLDFRVIRYGYYNTRRLLDSFGGEKGIISLCFSNFLWALKNTSENYQIWPIIETDRSFYQEANTAGSMQRVDYMSVLPSLSKEDMWLKDSSFCEVFFMTKSSGYGSIVDCMSYLLHVGWMEKKGYEITKFKKTIANIALQIDTIDHDEVVQMKFRKPNE